MKSFPKQLCLDLNRDLDKMKASALYDKYTERFADYLTKNNTTEALARQFTESIYKLY